MRFSVFCFLLAAIVPTITTNAAQIINQPRPPGEIFATPLYVFEVRSGAEQGQLQVRYLRGRTGYANGTIFGGDRVTGYHYVPPAGGQETLALVRYRGAAPIQIITAGPSGGGWSGVAVAIDAAAGAAQQQDTVGFRAAPTNCKIGAPDCVPGVIPIAPRAPTPFTWSDPIAGLPINANGFPGILVFRTDAMRAQPGAFVGQVLGERILGHYASGAGTIGFLRYDASGAPYQGWVGVLDQNGVSRGSGYPLAPNGAEAFVWSGQVRPQGMVGIRSTTGNSLCLTQGPALGGACQHEWLLMPAAVYANRPTEFRLVNKGNGLCLELPSPAGTLAREVPCSGVGLAQQIGMDNSVVSGDGIQTFSNYVNTLADFVASSNLRVVSSARSCLVVRATDQTLVSGSCDSNRANWAQVP